MKRLFFVPRFLFLTVFFLFAVYCSLVGIRAQEPALPEPPSDAAPPPMAVLSKEEKQQLNLQNDIKKRTKLSMELMETRLKTAEALAGQDKFQETINELGGFQALLENTLNFLIRKDNGSSKIDYNFKRLEIGLRPLVSRLELVRRELPFKYGYYVVKLQKYVREARAKAVEPLFSDSVVPEAKAETGGTTTASNKLQ